MDDCILDFRSYELFVKFLPENEIINFYDFCDLFLKQFADNNHITYNEEKKEFTFNISVTNYLPSYLWDMADLLKSRTHVLKLTDEQAAELKKSSKLSYLYDIAKENKKYRDLKQVFGKDDEKKELPTTIGEVEDDINVLDGLIKDTGAVLTKDIPLNIMCLLNVPVLLSIAVLSDKTYNLGPGMLNTAAKIGVSLMFALSLFSTSLSSVWVVPRIKESFGNIADLVKYYKKRIELIKRYKLLEKNGNAFQDLIEKNKKTDELNVKEYKDKFIDEIKNVRNLIVQLPEEERHDYVLRLQSLLDEYYERAAKIQDDIGNIELGRARHIHELFMELLPEVAKVEIAVNERLTELENITSLQNEYNDLTESIKSIDYNSWSDDLESGPYAYSH